MTDRAKTTAEATRASREKLGVRATSFTFSPEERELLERMEAQHGGKKAAIMAGLRALERRNDPSNAELVAMISRRLGA